MNDGAKAQTVETKEPTTATAAATSSSSAVETPTVATEGSEGGNVGDDEDEMDDGDDEDDDDDQVPQDDGDEAWEDVDDSAEDDMDEDGDEDEDGEEDIMDMNDIVNAEWLRLHVFNQVLGRPQTAVRHDPETLFFDSMTNINCQSSANHFQCANALVVASNQTAFVVNSSRVMLVQDFARPQVVVRLNFRPICMTTKYGWVLVADSDGKMACFAVAPFEGDNDGAALTPAEAAASTLSIKKVSNTMNNSVELFVDADGETLRVLLSCNDCTVCVLSFPSLQPHHVISGYPQPINDSRMSPDGTMIASVGDCRDLFLVSVTPSTEAPLQMRYSAPRRIATDLPQCESRQYLAWNSTGNLIAMTSDSAVEVVVVDCRAETILRRIPAGGQTYAVAFSPSNPTLLAFSNRSQYLHVVDVATGIGQTLLGVDLINGLSFSPDGQYLYAAYTSLLYRFRLLGVRSLVDTCISFIQDNKELAQSDDIKYLPASLRLRLFPLAPRARRPRA